MRESQDATLHRSLLHSGAKRSTCYRRRIVETLFDSPHFVVVDKPAGMLSIPSRVGESDPRLCAGKELEAKLGVRLWPVHRLDLEVSGLLLFAKNASAHRAANGWFEGHQVRKVYQALSENRSATPLPDGPVQWRSLLVRGKKRTYESPHGKEATTLARYLGPATDGNLAWQLEPTTGRSHQLRVHLAAHGFPIVGDTLYGAAAPYEQKGIALRAVELNFDACAGREVLELPAVIRAHAIAGWPAT